MLEEKIHESQPFLLIFLATLLAMTSLAERSFSEFLRALKITTD